MVTSWKFSSYALSILAAQGLFLSLLYNVVIVLVFHHHHTAALLTSFCCNDHVAKALVSKIDDSIMIQANLLGNYRLRQPV